MRAWTLRHLYFISSLSLTLSRGSTNLVQSVSNSKHWRATHLRPPHRGEQEWGASQGRRSRVRQPLQPRGCREGTPQSSDGGGGAQVLVWGCSTPKGGLDMFAWLWGWERGTGWEGDGRWEDVPSHTWTLDGPT